MPENSIEEYTLIWVVKTHIIACGVIKTLPNNHSSHVGYDTRPLVYDTRPVDLENSYWNRMEQKSARIVLFHLLMLVGPNRSQHFGRSLKRQI